MTDFVDADETGNQDHVQPINTDEVHKSATIEEVAQQEHDAAVEFEVEIVDELITHYHPELGQVFAKYLTEDFRYTIDIALKTLPKAEQVQACNDLKNLALRGRLRVGDKMFKLVESLRDVPGKATTNTISHVRRFAMGLYLKNKPLLESAMSERVSGAHGSASGSLVTVLQHGLLPQQKLEELGISIATGEQVEAGASVNRDNISMFHWHTRYSNWYGGLDSGESNSMDEQHYVDIIQKLEEQIQEFPPESIKHRSMKLAIQHAQHTLSFLQKENKTTEEQDIDSLIRENFPVIYLGSVDSIDKDDIIVPGNTIDPEFAVKDELEVEHVPIILVPRKYISRVEKLVDKYRDLLAYGHTKVFPLEDYYGLVFGNNDTVDSESVTGPASDNGA